MQLSVAIWPQLTSYRPGNLNPTRGGNEMHLTWRHNVRPFTSDFNVYIWEQHKSLSTVEHARVIFCPADANGGEFRLLVNFTNCRTLAAFTKRRTEASKNGCSDASKSWTSPSSYHVHEMAVSLGCIFQVIIADTAEFLGVCHDQASQMVSRPFPFVRT